MSEEIRPALSAEEWAEAANPLYVAIALSRHAHTGERLDALAALALQHAGPDGGAMFTHEIVDALEAAIGADESWTGISEDEYRLAQEAIANLRTLLPLREQ